MQYSGRSGSSSPPPHLRPAEPCLSSLEPLASGDAVRLLQLMAATVALRNDPRAWRQELLTGLNGVLGTRIAVAMILKNLAAAGRREAAEAAGGAAGGAAESENTGMPVVVSLFDAGFRLASYRSTFLHEFSTAPFRDPLFRAVLARVVDPSVQTFTALRADLVDEETWTRDPHMIAFRRAKSTGDAALSIQKSAEPGTAYALYVFHAPEEEVSGDTRRFEARDRTMLDSLHRGLNWLYRAEESTHHLTRATGLAAGAPDADLSVGGGHGAAGGVEDVAVGTHGA